MILDLAPDSDIHWRTFNAKLRNQIGKAATSGLQFVAGHLELLEGSMRFHPQCVILVRRSTAKAFWKHSLILRAFLLSTMKRELLLPGSAGGLRTLKIPWASSMGRLQDALS
jgi:hypothetical protein